MKRPPLILTREFALTDNGFQASGQTSLAKMIACLDVFRYRQRLRVCG